MDPAYQRGGAGGQPSPRIVQQQSRHVQPAPQQQQRQPTQLLPQHQIRRQPRISEIIEALKQEADQLIDGVNIYKVQRDEYESKLQVQLKEQSNIQSSIQELANVSNKIKQQYEEEILRLRRDLDMALKQLKRFEGQHQHSHQSQQSQNSSSLQQPQLPPNLKHKNGNGDDKASMFGSLMDHPSKRFKTQGEEQQQASPNKQPGAHQPHPGKQQQAPIDLNINNQPITGECLLNHDTTPASCKQEGSDWHVLYNPNISALSQSRVSLDLVHTLAHESVVCCVKFSNCGKFLATGSNHVASIFDVSTGEKLYVLGNPPPKVSDPSQPPGEIPDLYIRSVVFSPDFTLLATGAEDRTIRVWDIQTQRIKHTFLGHDQEIYSLDWSKDGRILVSGSGDKCVKVWDMDQGVLWKSLVSLDAAPEGGKESGVTSVTINPVYTRCVASGSLDMIVRVWDTRTGTLLERFEGHSDSVYSVAFSPNGRSIVSGALDQHVKIWDLSDATLEWLARDASSPIPPLTRPLVTRICRHTFRGHKDYVLSVAFIGTNGAFGRVDSHGDPVSSGGGDILADVEWVVSGSKDWTITFWDAKSEESGENAAPRELGDAAQFMLQGHVNSVISVCPAPSGGIFASGAGDCKARVWRISSTCGGPRMGPIGTGTGVVEGGLIREKE